MKSSSLNSLWLAVSTTTAYSISAAESRLSHVNFFVRSNNSEIGGLKLNSINEGPGLDYIFLVDTEKSNLELTRDSRSGTIISIPTHQELAILDGFVCLSKGYSLHQISFVDTKEVVDNESNSVMLEGRAVVNSYLPGSFYGCKGVNDPGNYSSGLWELLYFPDIPPEGCHRLDLVARYEG